MDIRREYFQSDKNDQLMIRDANFQDNAQLLKLVAETMPSNGMTLSFERGNDYFKAAHVQYHQPDIKVVVKKDQPDVIIGMMNIGFKNCYINAQTNKIRYVSDLRIDPAFRGRKVIEVLMDYLYSQIPVDDFFQSVVLEDNHKAKHMLHRSRPHFPEPYILDQMTTFNISKVPSLSQFKQFSMHELTEDLIHIANQFVADMREFFNFLPLYNFNDLNRGDHPLWQGLRLNDFKLVFNLDQHVVGIMGLWNQKQLKQTKVVEYSTTLHYLRPFYNVYASMTHQMKLPKVEDCFDYLMAHSVLSHPKRLDVFAYQLYQLNSETQKQGKSSFCITLSQDDPRYSAAQKTRSHKMHAIHALHSFKNTLMGEFDRSKISYFEVGRL